MPSRCLLVALAALLPAPRFPQAVVLPEGPGARAWAAVGAGTEPLPPDGELARILSADPFGEEAWRAWTARLLAAADDDGPAARADLCLVALEQGRHLDAWGHYARLVADPARAAGLRQHLWPGVPLDVPAGPGGATPPLPAGVLLRPALPEPSGTWQGEEAFAAILYEMRAAELQGLEVGGSTLDLRLSVESTGVKLSTWLRSGDPVELRILMPEPPGYAIEIEYVDWLKAEGAHAVRSLVPQADGEAWVVFSRVGERDVERPAGTVARLPAGLRLGGLVLEDEGGENALPALPPAELLEAAVGAPVRVVDPGAAAREGFPGVRMRVPAEGEARRRALCYLASALETHRLAAP